MVWGFGDPRKGEPVVPGDYAGPAPFSLHAGELSHLNSSAHRVCV